MSNGGQGSLVGAALHKTVASLLAAADASDGQPPLAGSVSVAYAEALLSLLSSLVRRGLQTFQYDVEQLVIAACMAWYLTM